MEVICILKEVDSKRALLTNFVRDQLNIGVTEELEKMQVFFIKSFLLPMNFFSFLMSFYTLYI